MKDVVRRVSSWQSYNPVVWCAIGTVRQRIRIPASSCGDGTRTDPAVAILACVRGSVANASGVRPGSRIHWLARCEGGWCAGCEGKAGGVAGGLKRWNSPSEGVATHGSSLLYLERARAAITVAAASKVEYMIYKVYNVS